jgi:DNA-binding NtrC family response regulator
VDVRVIAATNRSLLTSVKEKTFRMDLFYRLRVVNFFLPPLRDRTEDIPLLVDLFVKKFSKKYGKNVKGVSPETMALLTAHQFDGNIRELKNVINSAVVFCRGDILVPGDFESFLKTKAGTGFKEVDLEAAGDDYYEVFWSMLEPVFDGICQKNKGAIYESVNMGLEKALIHMAMEKSNNNQVFAAKLLGISRNTLRDRLERYRIGANDGA